MATYAQLLAKEASKIRVIEFWKKSLTHKDVAPRNNKAVLSSFLCKGTLSSVRNFTKQDVSPREVNSTKGVEKNDPATDNPTANNPR